MTMLACENLSVQVGHRTLVRNLSLKLRAGDLLGIVGTNGAGKTTLLRALVGLLPSSQGRVELAEKALAAWPARARAKLLGYLPQGHSVHWPLPGRDVVALGRLPHGDAQTSSGRLAIEQAMDITDTTAFAATTVQTLSGGERARVMLARVLAGNPAALLADEPLAALDPAHQLRMMALLQRQASQGRAIGMVLHDLALAARFCTRVAVLHQGQLLAEGPPASVLTDHILAQAFGVRGVRLEHAGVACTIPWELADG